MPSSNIFTAKDVINLLVNGINKTRLEEKLTASGWTATPARGGSKSGSGTIWSSPNLQCSVRVMNKTDGSSYARVYNGPGGGAPGEQALNPLAKPASRQETHFILIP